VVGDAWWLAAAAREQAAAQLWGFGVALGGLVLLARREARARLLWGLAALLTGLVLWPSA